MPLTHNSKLADDEPDWGSVDKTKLPRSAFADQGEPDKKSTWTYPHHWVKNGTLGDEGVYVDGDMYLHKGGLNAAWAAAQGARSGEKAPREVIDHLQAHRTAIGADEKAGTDATAQDAMKRTFASGRLPLRICNAPLLILPAALNHIISVVNRAYVIPAKLSPPGNQRIPQLQEGVAVIPVHGVLTYRGDDIFSWLFGGTAYDEIRAQFRSALSDPAVKAIIFDIDSPGGEAAGVFDLVDEIYQARGIKPIYAAANEAAYSAAYAIASAADTIYVPRTGRLGSIGVIAMHVDQSKWDENIGVRYTPIFAGARKNDFTPHEPLSAEAKAAGQAMVDEVYGLFVRTVARNRGMTPGEVRSTEAALYQGENAVDAGLADAVMSWDRAVADIVKKNKIKGGTVMTFVERIKALFASAPAEEITPGLAEAGFIAREEADRLIRKAQDSAQEEALAGVIGILEVCSAAGMEKIAIECIKDKLTLEQAREKIIDAKATAAEKTQIRSTVGALSTGDVNPLIEDAKKRAADANIRVVKK